MKFDVYQYINEIFIKQYKKYLDTDLKWKSNVSRFEYKTLMPYNPVSEVFFTGFNRYILHMAKIEKQFQASGWATFKQIQKVGGTVKKGAKSVMVIRPEFYHFYKEKKISSKKYLELYNNPNIDKIDLVKRIYFKAYNVFNLDETLNMKHLIIKDNKELLEDFKKIDIAETIIDKSGAKIEFDDNKIPFYNPQNDTVVMPHKKYFDNEDGFYSTFFHELSHWSLSPQRLNLRPKNFKNNYAFEELIAEMSSQYLSFFSGVNKSMKNDTLPYIKGWLTALESDPKYIYKAMTFAQKSSDYLLEKSGLKMQLNNALKVKIRDLKDDTPKLFKSSKTEIDNNKNIDFNKKEKKRKKGI